jgi:hypothetical protein
MISLLTEKIVLHKACKPRQTTSKGKLKNQKNCQKKGTKARCASAAHQRVKK